MSEVAICNAALTLLGADIIQALTDESERARVMNQRYAAVRDAELRRMRWKFAIRRTTLPALAAEPEGSQYTTQYQIPNDCLRVIQIGEVDLGLSFDDFRSAPNEAFSIEGHAVLTNLEAPLFIRYIAQITDTASFDVAFTEALSARLAFTCCERITQSDSKRQLCWSEYKQAVKEAARVNAFESASSQSSDDTWVMARAL